MENPHLLHMENGRRVMVDVKRIEERRAIATWRGITIYPNPRKLTRLNPEHILPYSA